ncbi:unnamed protein product [Sympodiomycopsis kandeliae]
MFDITDFGNARRGLLPRGHPKMRQDPLEVVVLDDVRSVNPLLAPTAYASVEQVLQGWKLPKSACKQPLNSQVLSEGDALRQTKMTEIRIVYLYSHRSVDNPELAVWMQVQWASKQSDPKEVLQKDLLKISETPAIK